MIRTLMSVIAAGVVTNHITHFEKDVHKRLFGLYSGLQKAEPATHRVKTYPLPQKIIYGFECDSTTVTCDHTKFDVKVI